MIDNATLKMQFLFSLRKAGVLDKQVLDAMERVDRKNFVNGVFSEKAYEDTPLPIACGQTISQPTVVGLMTQALQVTSRDKLLEVGTGSGYQAAVLSELNVNVHTIERQKELFVKTKNFLPTIGYQCMFIYGDGYKGLPKFAPFDRILITCGAPSIPNELLKQLKIGGKMVAPIGDGEVQIMHLIEKISDSDLRITKHGKFSFVPMLSNKENRS